MKAPLLKPLFAVSALFAFGIAPLVSAATIYNAADDFGAANPSGVWSYFYTSTSDPASTYNPLDAYNTNGSLNIWSSLSVGDPPSVVKNISGAAIDGILPGAIGLHPGPGNQNAVLRFTAPETGSYSFSIQFFVGNVGDTDGYILLNGNTAAPLSYAVTTDTNPLWENTLPLTSGDTVDILVGSKGAYNSDTTPVNAVITAVPEPSSTAMMLGAGVCASAFRRRSQERKR